MRLAESATWGEALAVTAGVMIVLTALYRFAIRRQGRIHRVILIALRCCWAALAVLIFLRPVMDEILPPARRILAVLLDSSLSMSVPAGEITRYESARRALETLRREARGWVVRPMAFSQGIDESGMPDRAGGTATDLAAAIDAGRMSAGPGGAVVLLTDGVTTTGDRPMRAAERAASAGMPVVALYPPAQAVSERRIVRVEYDPVTNRNRPTGIRVHTAGPGPYGIRLMQNQNVLAWAQAADDPSVVTLTNRPADLGQMDMRVDIEPARDEGLREIFTADNSCALTQRVVPRREAVIAVLWVEPRWDVRGIVTSLESVNGVSVRSVAGSPESWAQPAGPMGLAELDYADAVILVGVPARSMGTAVQEALASAVENGMGLAMVGGPEGFGRGGWSGTPLARTLPVEIHSNELFMDAAAFKPRPTPLGLQDPLMKNDFGFPLTQKANAVGRLRPAGVALLVHPAAAGEGGPAVLLARGRYGDGRTMAIAMADLWRWAYQSETGRAAMETFWRRVAAYLAPVEPTRLFIQAGGVWAVPGEEVEVHVRVTEPRQGPQGRVAWKAAGAGTVDSGILPAAGGRIRVRPPAEGTLSITVQAPASEAGPAEEARAVVNISSVAEEVKQFGPDTSLLAAIAKATSGISASFRDAGRAFDSLSGLATPGARKRERDVWDRPWILALLIGLLSVEWTLRRWWGLP